MGKILIPPKREKINGPLIFLAGPITGAPDWQSEAIDCLSGKTDAAVVSPRRPPQENFTEKDFVEREEWEHHIKTTSEKAPDILLADTLKETRDNALSLLS